MWRSDKFDAVSAIICVINLRQSAGTEIPVTNKVNDQEEVPADSRRSLRRLSQIWSLYERF